MQRHYARIEPLFLNCLLHRDELFWVTQGRDGLFDFFNGHVVLHQLTVLFVKARGDCVSNYIDECIM